MAWRGAVRHVVLCCVVLASLRHVVVCCVGISASCCVVLCCYICVMLWCIVLAGISGVESPSPARRERRTSEVLKHTREVGDGARLVRRDPDYIPWGDELRVDPHVLWAQQPGWSWPG